MMSNIRIGYLMLLVGICWSLPDFDQFPLAVALLDTLAELEDTIAVAILVLNLLKVLECRTLFEDPGFDGVRVRFPGVVVRLFERAITGRVAPTFACKVSTTSVAFDCICVGNNRC